MKKIIIAILVLLCVGAGVVYFLRDRVSYQPDWYLEDNTTGQDLMVFNADLLERKIKSDLKKGKSVTIPANRIPGLIVNQLEKKTGFEISAAVKASRVTINSGQIEMEMIVDVRQVPTENLPEDAQKVLEHVLKLVPENALKDLYVKCSLQPEKHLDGVSLDSLAGISIGKINLPLSEIEKKIGSKRKAGLKSLPVSDFKLTKNALILKPK